MNSNYAAVSREVCCVWSMASAKTESYRPVRVGIRTLCDNFIAKLIYFSCVILNVCLSSTIIGDSLSDAAVSCNGKFIQSCTRVMLTRGSGRIRKITNIGGSGRVESVPCSFSKD